MLEKVISADLASTILVQYVPHAFGLKAMNLFFCCWLRAHRNRKIVVMFHEVVLGEERPLVRYAVLRQITRVMAKLVVESASRVFVSTAGWAQVLQPMLSRPVLIEVLPVPSNVEVVDSDAQTVATVRSRFASTGNLYVGHFGTYSPKIQAYLLEAIPPLLQDQRVHIMLIGKGSLEFRQTLVSECSSGEPNVHATGELRFDELSRHLSACDLLIQPYPDGITTRRTSAMAAIAHGRPVVSTAGRLTEAIWSRSGAISLVPAHEPATLATAAKRLLSDPNERHRLGSAGFELYQKHFHLRHTINALRK
jgi:glycosyltransferase involved in cell wall biosynthesis